MLHEWMGTLYYTEYVFEGILYVELLRQLKKCKTSKPTPRSSRVSDVHIWVREMHIQLQYSKSGGTPPRY